jgi:hypothetical protein
MKEKRQVDGVVVVVKEVMPQNYGDYSKYDSAIEQRKKLLEGIAWSVSRTSACFRLS